MRGICPVEFVDVQPVLPAPQPSPRLRRPNREAGRAILDGRRRRGRTGSGPGEDWAAGDTPTVDRVDVDQPATARGETPRQQTVRRSRTNKAAPQVRGPKTAATERTTARSRGPKPSSVEQSPPQLALSATPATSAPVPVEPAPPAREAAVPRSRPTRVFARGGQRRGSAPLALPAGQRWKRRLPRVCW